jgi:hypothetical protein
VLFNGVPGKPFKCKRGVRKDDPLSPLLFVMDVDLLQSIINNAYHLDLLKHPLSKDFGLDYLIVQYVDDTLIVLPTNAWQLMALKGLTKLKVNFSKSFLVAINVPAPLHLYRRMGCQVAEMSFTYLGLPLGTTRHIVEDFHPLLNRIEMRMMGINRLLSYQGRLTLVNSVLSSLPTFFMCSLKVPIKIWDQVDKYRKHCLWNKGDVNRRGAQRSRGLGIIYLRAQNAILLPKFLHKFYNKHFTLDLSLLITENMLGPSGGGMSCPYLIIFVWWLLAQLMKVILFISGGTLGMQGCCNGNFNRFIPLLSIRTFQWKLFETKIFRATFGGHCP